MVGQLEDVEVVEVGGYLLAWVVLEIVDLVCSPPYPPVEVIAVVLSQDLEENGPVDDIQSHSVDSFAQKDSFAFSKFGTFRELLGWQAFQKVVLRETFDGTLSAQEHDDRR